jgi:hypothetical protein
MKSPSTEDAIHAYLQANGVTHPALVHDVLSGFDPKKPIYETLLDFDDELYQYIRKPATGRPDLRVGNWFCIGGATRGGLAIIDGLAGRELHRFRVVSSFSGLEGTASKISRNWRAEIGGRGGSTQIYVPPRFMGHIQSAGTAAQW